MENNDNIYKSNMINEFLTNRPNTLGVFGYGSGVTKQNGYGDTDRPQIDLILAVENDRKWHQENIERNPSDYSLSGKIFFKDAPTSIYHLGSDICYLTDVKYQNQSYKFGVINKEKLIDDLLHWKTFYLAGRFQKPMLKVKSDCQLDEAIDINQYNALLLALTLLGEGNYTVRDIYNKVCSLSYIGDTRMGIAENPNKVNNIVDGSFETIDGMYNRFDLFSKDSITDKVNYDMNYIKSLISRLPFYIAKPNNKLYYTSEELLNIRKKLIGQLTIKNRDASVLQTIKGFVTAGPGKSFGYVYKKINKRILSKH